MTTISATATTGNDTGGRPLGLKARQKLATRDLIHKIGPENLNQITVERIRAIVGLYIAIADRVSAINDATPLAELLEIMNLADRVAEAAAKLDEAAVPVPTQISTVAA
jgi:hypothetical protein